MGTSSSAELCHDGLRFVTGKLTGVDNIALDGICEKICDTLDGFRGFRTRNCFGLSARGRRVNFGSSGNLPPHSAGHREGATAGDDCGILIPRASLTKLIVISTMRISHFSQRILPDASRQPREPFMPEKCTLSNLVAFVTPPGQWLGRELDSLDSN